MCIKIIKKTRKEKKQQEYKEVNSIGKNKIFKENDEKSYLEDFSLRITKGSRHKQN